MWRKFGKALFVLLIVAWAFPWGILPILEDSFTYSNQALNRTELGALVFPTYAGDRLVSSFEEQQPILQDALKAKSIDYSIEARRATISLHQKDGSERQLLLEIGRGEIPLGKLGLSYLGAFSPEERKMIAGRLGNLDLRLLADQHSVEHALFSDFFSFSIAYLIVVTFFMAFCLIGIGKWILERLSKDDLPLLFLLALSAIGLWGFTTMAPCDIKMHYINQETAYRFDVYGPGAPAFQLLLYRVAPVNDVSYFIANQILGLLCIIPFVWFATRRSGSRLGAYIAALVLVTHPMWLRYMSSDGVHALAFFLFFSAAAILSDPKEKRASEIGLALLSLTLSMLCRAELMVFSLALLLLLQPQDTWNWVRRLFRERPLLLWGMLLLVLICIQIFAILLPSTNRIVGFDIDRSLRTWFGSGEYNSFAAEKFSPLLHRGLVLIGIAGLILTGKAGWVVGIWLITVSLLFNKFLQQPVFFVTHYQIAALPFYALLATGVGCLAEKLGDWRILYSRKRSAALAGFAVLSAACLWAGPIADENMLSAPYTFMQEYRALQNHKEQTPPACTFVYYRPWGDHALTNVQSIWFAEGDTTLTFMNLYNENWRKEEKFAPPSSGCLVFYKGPSCELEDLHRNDEHPMFIETAKTCKDFMVSVPEGWEPIWTESLTNVTAFHETYRHSTIPIGLYRAKRK